MSTEQDAGTPHRDDPRTGGASASAGPHGGRGRRRWLGRAGVLLLVVGLCILGWIGYEFWGSNIVARHRAQEATQALQQQWQHEHAGVVAPDKLPVAPGQPFALIRIPRLGSSWQYPVLDGTTPDVLARGVGWYDTTSRPGAIGNFAVAAHRVTHGEPFRHLLLVRAGDQVIVETRDHVYTYVIDQPATDLTVQENEGWVLDPVPGHPGQKPTRALITLTTCTELFHAPTRSVAFGHLVNARTR